MPEVIVIPSGGRIVGSLLLARRLDPIMLTEGTREIDIETRHINTLSIDIESDVACTVQMIRLPDGETEGEASTAVSVSAGVPAHHTYSAVQCGWMRIKIVNTSGTDMTAFALYVRGGA